jgi:arylsulfatase A-like enzyme
VGRDDQQQGSLLEQAIPQRHDTLVRAGLAGALIFGVAGLAETLILCAVKDYPEPLRFLRVSVVGYLAFGLAVGAAWSVAWRRAGKDWCEQKLAAFHKRSTSVLAALFLAAVYTTLYWPANGALSLGLPWAVPVIVESIAGAALVLLLWRRYGREKQSDRSGDAGAGRLHLVLALLLIAVMVLPALPALAIGAKQDDRPNIVLIVMDTTRFDRLSAYGYDRPTTPALDQIASEGVLFTRAHAASPWTLPSHASIFTGVFPSEHRAIREHQFLDDRFPTLAEKLGDQGYHTVAFAKKSYVSHESGLARGFDQFFDLFFPLKESALMEAWKWIRGPLPSPDKGAALIVATAKDWLERNGDRCFFAFFNFNEPHNHLAPPSPYYETYLGHRTETGWGRTRFPDILGYNLGETEYNEEQLAIFNDLYDAEVAYQDYRMGQLFDFMRNGGLLENTLLIITADHGENLGDHDLMGHDFSLHETLIRVPLIIRFPDATGAGTVIDRPVENRLLGRFIDLFVARRPQAHPLSEGEFVETLSDERTGGAVIAELYRPSYDLDAWNSSPHKGDFDRRLKCILDDRQKYIWSSDGREERYDLASDPWETSNLTGPVGRSPSRDQGDEPTAGFERLEDLLRAQAHLWVEMESEDAPQFSEEMIKRLRSLGYLGGNTTSDGN